VSAHYTTICCTTFQLCSRMLIILCSDVCRRSSEVECAQLRERLGALLSSEGQLLSEEAQDSRKLTALVRDLGDKLEELEELQGELAQERLAREAAQRQLSEQAVSSQVSQVGRSALDHQVSVLQLELMKLQEAHRKLEHDSSAKVSVLEGAKASLEEQVTGLQKELLVTKDALALSQERLTQQTNLAAKASVAGMDVVKLQAEAAALKDQLVLCQRDAFAAKEELRTSQEAMQAEYGAMWASVQELSKLDALKDQSIQDLIADRDRAVLERDSAFERYAAAKAENTQLAQEIQVSLLCLVSYLHV
jgi:chromosome segregation ATPase